MYHPESVRDYSQYRFSFGYLAAVAVLIHGFHFDHNTLFGRTIQWFQRLLK